MHLLAMLGLLACQSGEKADDSDVLDDTTSDTTPDSPDASDTTDASDTDTDADADTDADTDTDTDTDTALPADLNGSPPVKPVPPLASFDVVNRHGENVGPTDLEGTPTVMWFYPAAATGG